MSDTTPDAAAMPKIEPMDGDSGDGIEAPATAVETAIADAWAEVLGIEPIGRGDRFSDLGGTSLGAEKTLILLRRALGRDLGAELLADDPTVAELGEAIEARCAEDFGAHRPTCTKLSDGPVAASTGSDAATPAPVFMFAGAGASAVGFLPLGASLAGRRESWAFHAHGFHSRGLADPTLGAHARRHLRDVRRISPTGPVILLGHSFGGHIAMECARRLAKEGREVAKVILLDTMLAADGQSVADIRMAANNTTGEWVTASHAVTGDGESGAGESGAGDEAVPDGGAAAGGPSAPPLRERLRTHWRILTAGLVRHEPVTQQAVFWEHAIRIQNRLNVTGTPPRTVVLVTDENEVMADRWAALSPAPRVVRIPGDHLSPLNDPAALRTIVDEIDGA